MRVLGKETQDFKVNYVARVLDLQQKCSHISYWFFVVIQYKYKFATFGPSKGFPLMPFAGQPMILVGMENKS